MAEGNLMGVRSLDMAEGQLIDVHSLGTWTQHFETGKTSNKLIAVHFIADWVEIPCSFISRQLARAAKERPTVTFLQVDVDELETLVNEWDVETVPTVLFFKKGKRVDKFVGVDRRRLLQKIELHATDAAA